MRKIKCDEILNRNDFINLNDKDFNEQVLKYCLDKMNEYQTSATRFDCLKKYPEKKYEIFKIDIQSERIFILDTNLINYHDELKERELYYSRAIANEICENMKRLHEDAVMLNPELKVMYKDDIDKISNKILELKQLDEDEYNLDRFIYNSLEETNILEEYNDIILSKKDLEEENQNLKERVKKSEEKILELTNKLKVSLDNIEENRKKLHFKNKNLLEKMLDRLKDFIN